MKLNDSHFTMALYMVMGMLLLIGVMMSDYIYEAKKAQDYYYGCADEVRQELMQQMRPGGIGGYTGGSQVINISDFSVVSNQGKDE